MAVPPEMMQQARALQERIADPNLSRYDARQIMNQMNDLADRIRESQAGLTTGVPPAPVPGLVEYEQASAPSELGMDARLLANEALQGVTMGGADEAFGLISPDAMNQMRQESQVAREIMPEAAMAANIGGGLMAPGLGTARFVSQARSVPQQLRRAAGSGLVLGGTGGALASDPAEGTEDSFMNRAIGAGFGGALGAFLGPLVTHAGNLLGRFGSAGAERSALGEIGRRLDLDETTPEQMLALQPTGAPETLPQLQARAMGTMAPQETALGGLQRSVATTPGPGRALTARNLRRQLQGGMDPDTGQMVPPQFERISSMTEGTFGSPRAQMNTERANQLYEAYFSRPFPLDDTTAPIRRLIDSQPSLRRGLQRGREVYLRQQADRVMTGDLTPDMPEAQWNWQVLHNAKTGLDSQLAQAARAGDRPRVRELTALKRRYLDALETVNDAYGPARRFYAGEAAVQEARTMGQDLGRSTPEDIRNLLQDMTPQQQDQFRAGAAEAMIGEISRKAGDTPDYARVLIRSPDWVARVRAVAPDQETADAFIERLRAESRAQQSFTNTFQGSQTQLRAAEEEAGGFFSSLWDAMTGSSSIGRGLATASQRAMRNLVGGAPGPYERQIADMLTTTNPQRISDVLGMVRRPYQLPGTLPGAAAVGITASEGGASAQDLRNRLLGR